MKHIRQLRWRLYLMEALGLAIFMISACFFSAILESETSVIRKLLPAGIVRLVIMGVMMGLTALVIFYSRFTMPSGSHINPAVTIAFFRLGRIGVKDTILYILFQFIGGTAAVFFMAVFMGSMLTAPPVNYVVTVPMQGWWSAAITEFIIAFLMMSMVLLTSESRKLSAYTRIIAACMVCCYVIIAGPVSGFGMNPARTFSSALPSGIWAGWYIYMLMPVAGMLLSAELFLRIKPLVTVQPSYVSKKQ